MKNPTFDLNKTIFLMDGTAAAYRAFYAVRELSNSKGIPTNAVYGFVNILKRMFKVFDPSYFVIFFDTGKKTFRHDVYDEYKSHRPPTPDELKSQLKIIKNFVRCLDVPLIECDGYEADDVIATVAEYSANNGFKSVMITSDKDMFQIVDDGKIVNYNPNKSVFEDEKFIQDKLGIKPCYVTDYLALCGDASDNVPGVRGIGAKTAVNLITSYGDLDGIYANIENISSKAVVRKLVEDKEMAYLSKQLVTLECRVPIDLELENFKIGSPDAKVLDDFFMDLEFRTSANDFIKSKNIEKSSTAEFKSCDANVLSGIKKNKELVFCFFDEKLFLFNEGCVYNLEDEDAIGRLMEDSSIVKVAYNIKELSLFIEKRFNCLVKGQLFDIMVAGFLVDSSLRDYSLQSLNRHFLQDSSSDIDAAYATTIVFNLYQLLKPKISEDGLQILFENIEMPLISVLEKMQKSPLHLDIKFLEKHLNKLNSKIDKQKEEIFSLSNGEFNVNSPKQLSEILFERLGLEPVKKTKTGYSTNETVLLKLRDKHPIIDLILGYRKLSKLTSTYLEPFIKQAGEAGGFINPKFSQVSAQTGRLVSFNPNLQNIPVRDEESRKIRGGFISSFDEGMILSADYSQIELRILAHVSNDKNLQQAFLQGSDIHSYTASLLFEKPEGEVKSKERDFAKRINFAIVYGMSAFGLAKELKVSFAEAELFISNYFNRYPGVQNYIDTTIAYVKENSFVKTIFGRKRVLADINSSNKNLRDYALRQAVNAPIQGAAADIIKLAMIKINSTIEAQGLKSRMLLQIHDELVFDVPLEEVDILKTLVVENMEHAFDMSVPLKVNVKIGKTWLEATK